MKNSVIYACYSSGSQTKQSIEGQLRVSGICKTKRYAYRRHTYRPRNDEYERSSTRLSAYGQCKTSLLSGNRLQIRQVFAKQICGEIGHRLVGESRTSHNGTIYYYYTCLAKRKKYRLFQFA